jgi:hypothetical protein
MFNPSLSTKEKIDAIVNAIDDWDEAKVRAYAKECMRAGLENCAFNKEECVDLQYRSDFDPEY